MSRGAIAVRNFYNVLRMMVSSSISSPRIGLAIARTVTPCSSSEYASAADDASVFLLALDGMLADAPKPEVREQRVALLASSFAPARGGKR